MLGRQPTLQQSKIKGSLFFFLAVCLFVTWITWPCLQVKGKDPGKERLKIKDRESD